MTTTPTNGARQVTQGRQLIRVELTHDDGMRATLEGDGARRWADACSAVVSSAWIHGVKMPADLPWKESRATPSSDVGTEAMANALNAQAARLAEHDQIMRDLARAVGMSPADSPAALIARVREEHAELTALRPAVAAFYAAAKGLPSHVHTRPVCAVNGCDNGPRKDGLCAKHYGPFQKGYPVACCPKVLDEQKEGR